MAVTEQELQEIVRSVLSQMNGLRPSEQEETGIYDTMEEAIEAAARAQKSGECLWSSGKRSFPTSGS